MKQIRAQHLPVDQPVGDGQRQQETREHDDGTRPRLIDLLQMERAEKRHREQMNDAQEKHKKGEDHRNREWDLAQARYRDDRKDAQERHDAEMSFKRQEKLVEAYADLRRAASQDKAAKSLGDSAHPMAEGALGHEAAMVEALTRIRFYETNWQDLETVEKVLQQIVRSPQQSVGLPVDLVAMVSNWIVDRAKRGFSGDDS